jgi:hypothetical protein
MPEPKKTLVFFEGDDDKAFLEKLRDAKIWQAEWQLAERDKKKEEHKGKDRLIRQLLPFVSPRNGVGGHAVVLIDLDDNSLEQLTEWFSKLLEKDVRPLPLEVGPVNRRVSSFCIRNGDQVGRVALVGVGLPDNAELKGKYKIERFAIDDWIFLLALNQKVHDAVSDFRGGGKRRPRIVNGIASLRRPCIAAAC